MQPLILMIHVASMVSSPTESAEQRVDFGGILPEFC